MITPVTPVEITPGTASSWVTVDVGAHLGGDAGSVAGVVLRFVNTNASTTTHDFGARKPGSTDDLSGGLYQDSWTVLAAGLDANDEVEIYVGDTTDVDVYLIGYIPNSAGSFFTSAVDVTPATSGAWTTVDLSAHTGGDTPVVAFFMVEHNSSLSRYGLRPTGSTDDRIGLGIIARQHGALMGCDGSGQIDIYQDSQTVWFLGYMHSGASVDTNATSYATASTGSYVSVDASSQVSAGATGAFVHLHDASENTSSGGAWRGNVRKDSSRPDIYHRLANHQYAWVEIDSGTFEQKISETDGDLYVWGWTEPAGGGGTTHEVSVSENVDLTDAIANTADFAASLSESVELTDSTSNTADFAASVLESITLSDAITVTADFEASLTEPVTLTDSVNGGLVIAASLSEAITLAAAQDADISIEAQVSETLLLSDTLAVNADFAAQVTEALALAESASTLVDYDVAINEAITLAETLVGGALLEAGITENVTLSSTVTGQAITTGVTLSDGRTFTVVFEQRTHTEKAENRTYVVEP